MAMFDLRVGNHELKRNACTICSELSCELVSTRAYCGEGKKERTHMQKGLDIMEIATLKRGAIKITNSAQKMKLVKNKYHGFVITI